MIDRKKGCHRVRTFLQVSLMQHQRLVAAICKVEKACVGLCVFYREKEGREQGRKNHRTVLQAVELRCKCGLHRFTSPQ